MTAYLNALGVICALGRGQADVSRSLFAGDCTGMRAESGWVPERVLPVGGVHGELATIPPELGQQSSRNNQLLLEAALQIEGEIRQAIGTYGASRVGVVLGTSTSGIDEPAVASPTTCATASSPATTTTSNRNSAPRRISSPTGCN